MNSLPCLLLLFACSDAAELRIEPSADPTRVRVIARLPGDVAVDLLPDERDDEVGKHWLKLCLLGDDGKTGPPVFATYERAGDRLSLQPRYALTRGERYRAVLRIPGGVVLRGYYRVPPREPTSPAVVTRIAPAADVLPANLLKFYIHFSKPMREGRAIFDRIKLLDAENGEVIGPWRRQELWSRDTRRLTLWIHPGRIKTGVNLGDVEGPVLRPGRQYRLQIGADVQDANGRPLGRTYEKRFRAAAPDHQRPDPGDWKISSPRHGSRDPLRLTFREPLDRALLSHLIQIRDPDGGILAGEVEIATKELAWSFLPQKPWQSGNHSILVDGELEDLAGNTPLRVFDTDLAQPPKTVPRLSRPFEPTAEKVQR